MLVDSVLPAASELVMLYAGVLASGALPGQDVVLFGHGIDSHFWGYVAVAGAGWALGSSWETFHHDFRYVEALVGIGALALLVWYLRRRRATRMARRASDPAR